jgi:hypothetical protein
MPALHLPVLVLHVMPLPQIVPPVRSQPGTHCPLVQIVLGGLHCASLVQALLTMVQRPLVVSHTVPWPHAIPFCCPQPATHIVFWQMRAGAPHIASVVQDIDIGVSQCPLVVLHSWPFPHMSPLATPHPRTHCWPSQIVEGGRQVASVVQDIDCEGSTQSPFTQLCGLVHWGAVTHSTHSWWAVSQC